MQQHTKSNQFYEDEYDWITIQKMKEYDKRIQEAFNDTLERLKAQVLYDNYGAIRAGKRDKSIKEWRESDERKDKIIADTPIPENIFCKTCNTKMHCETHIFTQDDRLVFYFTCNHGHLPKRAIYSDGSERYIKSKVCSYCSGPLETKKKQTKSKLLFTDICKYCGKIEVDEYDLTEIKKSEITKEDRTKYCTSFIGARILQQDIQLIIDNADLFEEKNAKYDYSHIEQLNIAQLEKRMTEEIEKAGFVKVMFEKPNSGRYLTVEFSAQDSLSRDETSSLKAMKKVINKSLFPTNWRLMPAGISYKLGFLTGELKGYSVEEDLIKIGKEIEGKK